MKLKCRLNLILILLKGGDYINDDANLKLFMDHLIRFAV